MARRKSRTYRRSKTYSKKPTQKFPTNSVRVAKNTILTIIILVALVAISFILYHLIATPEFLVKREIESITSDYYENYFYPQILENNSIDKNETNQSVIEPVLSEALKKYVDNGFARLTLRQLLLYDNAKHSASSKYLSDYCNLDNTLIKVYPDSPFGRKNYHVDYSYSCKF